MSTAVHLKMLQVNVDHVFETQQYQSLLYTSFTMLWKLHLTLILCVCVLSTTFVTKNEIFFA